MKALVTGFGPFGDVRENPSEELARRLAANPPDGWEIEALPLRVAYREALESVRRVAESDAGLVLALGVHGRGDRMYVETAARRQVADAEDVDGEVSGPEALPDGPVEIASSLFDEDLAGAVKDERIAVSHDAGGYLCNFWYYCLLTAGGKPCGFVHVPHSEVSKPDGEHMTLDEQDRLLRRLLDAVRERKLV